MNLIPYNPVAGLPYGRPEPEAIDRFVAILRDRGVSVTVRKTKGRAIDAACGQLRRRLPGQRPSRRSDCTLATAWTMATRSLACGRSPR